MRKAFIGRKSKENQELNPCGCGATEPKGFGNVPPTRDGGHNVPLGQSVDTTSMRITPRIQTRIKLTEMGKKFSK